MAVTNLTKKQLEDIIAGLNGKLEGMSKKLDALENLPSRLSRMETLLEKATAENSSLRKALSYKEEQVNSLLTRLNNLEQHHRSWSIRINDLPIPAAIESNNKEVKKIVYDKLLLPILQGAVQKGELDAVPPVERTLEYAHILPAKNDGKRQVIARFFERDHRDAVFKCKKEFAPRSRPSAPDRPGRYCFPFFEDLTRTNFNKMRSIANHELVAACWSNGGVLKYKLKDSEQIKSVSNVLDTVENIINA
jgi:hypothetical protein